MAVVCSGLPALLNLCASGILTKSTLIHYILFTNNYDPSKFWIDDSQVRVFAKDIVDSLGYSIIFHGPFGYSCPPTEKRLSGEKIFFEEPRGVPIDQYNIVTANIVGYFGSQFQNTYVDIFPEGASCFNELKSNGNFWLRVGKKYKRKLKSYFFKSYMDTGRHLLLPDVSGRVKEFVSNLPNYHVLSDQFIFENYKKAAIYFYTKYPNFNFSALDAPFIHPVMDELDEKSNLKWINSFVNMVGSDPLIIKKRPRDPRNLDFISKINGNLNIVRVPNQFSLLPGELIVFQTPMKYIGYYTTLLLSFNSSDVRLIQPPENALANRKAATFLGLSTVLSL